MEKFIIKISWAKNSAACKIIDMKKESIVPKTCARKLEKNDTNVVRNVRTVTHRIIGSKNIVATVPNKFICSDKANKYGPTETAMPRNRAVTAFQKFFLKTFNSDKISIFSVSNFTPIMREIFGTTNTSPRIAKYDKCSEAEVTRANGLIKVRIKRESKIEFLMENFLEKYSDKIAVLTIMPARTLGAVKPVPNIKIVDKKSVVQTRTWTENLCSKKKKTKIIKDTLAPDKTIM